MPGKKQADPYDPAGAKLGIAVAAIEFGAPELDLGNPGQRAPLTDYARQAAMYLTHCSFDMTMTRIGDLFGLHRRYRVLTAPHFLLVYPQVMLLEGFDVASRRPCGSAAEEVIAGVDVVGPEVETVGGIDNQQTRAGRRLEGIAVSDLERGQFRHTGFP